MADLEARLGIVLSARGALECDGWGQIGEGDWADPALLLWGGLSVQEPYLVAVLNGHG